MRLSDLFPSKYLKATDLGDRQAPVIIEHILIEDIEGDEKTVRKPVLYFKGKDKGLVLNVTNANAIAAVYGEETDDWMGQQIILYSRMVDFKGAEVAGIRVNIPQVQREPVREMRQINAPSMAPERVPLRQPIQPQRRATVTADLNDEVPF